MKYPGKSGRFNLGPWVKGLNNVKPLEELGPDEVADCENFWFDERGNAQTRPGLVKKIDGVNCSGLVWAKGRTGLFFDSGRLLKFDADSWITEELANGFTEGPFRWDRIDDRMFFSDGRVHGRVFLDDWSVVEGWGAPDFTLTPSVSASSIGSIDPGRYFVGFTWVNSLGEESGCKTIKEIELTSPGGIALAFSGNVPSGIETIRVYATGANGKLDEMFRVWELPATQTNDLITDLKFGAGMWGLWQDAVSTPDLFAFYNGRVYWSKGSRVFVSDAMQYGCYDADWGELGSYGARVTVLGASMDGIFVVADRTYAYVGSSPEDFTRKVVNDSRGVFGSSTLIDGGLFGQSGLLPYWMSDRGPVLGLEGGKVQMLGKDQAEPDEWMSGQSGVVEQDGMVGIMTALKDYGGPNDRVDVRDNFSVKVISRGISE